MKHYKTPVVRIVEMVKSDILAVSGGNDMFGSDVIIGSNNPWGGN